MTNNPGDLGTDGDSVVVMKGVTFSYGHRTVLEALSLSIHTGITGLLGPNGAGKSTIMRLVAAVAQPEQGEVRTVGSSTSTPGQLKTLRKSIGYLPQDASWRESLTVSDFLNYFAWLRCIPRSCRSHAVETAVELTQLEPLQSRKLGALSGGESRRVMLAQVLLHTPALLILDEPTAGLDPSQRHHFRKVLASLRPSTSTLISTHLLEDVADLADDLLIVDSGRLLFQGSPTALSEITADGSGSVAGMQMGYMKLLAEDSMRG